MVIGGVGSATWWTGSSCSTWLVQGMRADMMMWECVNVRNSDHRGGTGRIEAGKTWEKILLPLTKDDTCQTPQFMISFTSPKNEGRRVRTSLCDGGWSLTLWFPSGWSEWILHHKHVTAFILPSLEHPSWVFESLTAGCTSTQRQKQARRPPANRLTCVACRS